MLTRDTCSGCSSGHHSERNTERLSGCLVLSILGKCTDDDDDCGVDDVLSVTTQSRTVTGLCHTLWCNGEVMPCVPCVLVLITISSHMFICLRIVDFTVHWLCIWWKYVNRVQGILKRLNYHMRCAFDCGDRYFCYFLWIMFFKLRRERC